MKRDIKERLKKDKPTLESKHEFIRKWPKNSRGAFKCSYCDGFGKVYNDADRDPYEGWKMASRTIPCIFCHGGEIGHNYVMMKYVEKEQAHKARLKKWMADAKKLNAALVKLTPTELQVLRKYS